MKSAILNCIIYRHDKVLKMVYNTQNHWVCELSTDPVILSELFSLNTFNLFLILDHHKHL
jgi:hypothetical protein